MLKENYDRFREATYRGAESGTVDHFFATTAGISLPGIDRLTAEIIADLGGHGIQWWSDYLDVQRNALITDHLLDCVNAVGSNLVQASLHLMELRGWWERESSYMAKAVVHDQHGQPMIQIPRPDSAADLLPREIAALHVDGLFRAIGSSLDCVGGVIVGVLGLRVDLRRADLRHALRSLRKNTAATDGNKLCSSFETTVAEIIDSAGPSRWNEWAAEYRNMLVHRGRRLHVGAIVPRNSGLVRQNGVPYAEVAHLLAAEPNKSQLEALVACTKSPHLAERAEHTLSGLLDSTVKTANCVAAQLVDIWRARRADPTLIAQPPEQWHPDISPAPARFEGYDPGSEESNFKQMVVSDDRIQRFRASALEASRTDAWKQTGGETNQRGQ